MASLKCSQCELGIHYNEQPNGIEYTAFSQDLWRDNSDSDKPIVEYIPFGNEDFLIVWRCPECGCIHAFNGYSCSLKQAYATTDEEIALESARKYLVFIDYLRDKVFDEEWSAAQFMQSGKYPNDQFFYAMVGDNGVVVYEDADCLKPLRRYKAIKTIMEE